MDKKLYIYEAGCLTKLYKENKFDIATKWRKELDIWAKIHGCKTFNPALTYQIPDNHKYSGMMAVKQNDFYLDATNIMIVQLDYLDCSPGTQYELTGYKLMGKPVIAFGDNPLSWSPHVMSCITEVCKDIDDVIKLLENMFEQSIKFN
jgi:nucleoside 2-deoxyribosyltransferase